MKDSSAYTENFAKQLGPALAESLSRTTGATWNGAFVAESAPASSGILFKFSLSDQAEPAGLICMERAQASALVQIMMGSEVSSETELSEDDSALLLGVFEEVVTTALRQNGVTGKITLLFDADAAAAGSVPVNLSVSNGNASIALGVLVTASGANAMQSATKSNLAQPSARRQDAGLDLVLDVELNVMVRFGRKQLTLKELSDLAAGSIVELDQEVQEPVELLLNDRVIALGDVVIIDGNYGLRITEVRTGLQEVSA